MTTKKQKVDNQIYGKVPPQSKDLEKSVLGTILLERDAFDIVIEILIPESFYVDAHKKVFAAMVNLARKNMPIDTLTVAEELIRSEELEAIGGPYYISKLLDAVVSGANVETHARIIAQHFIKREFIRIGGEMIMQGFDDSIDVFDMQDSIDKQISEIITGNRKNTYTPISTGVAKAIQRIEELRMNESHITGVESGFNSLDNITHGWQPTDLIILAARPSVGKTAFAGNVGVNAAKSFYSKSIQANEPAKSVAIFSLEMSTGQLINRMISCESEIWLENISNGRLDDEQMRTLYTKSVNQLSELPIFIDDSASLNIFELRAKCRRLKNKNNVGLIIIDYLQLMNGVGDSRNGNREQEISKISRDLKGLAKELQVPIIALSQLSRKTEDRKGEAKIPQLSDLRESGAIEQDADMVMFLYRPEYYDITANEHGETTKGETHVKIAKHRNGKLETIKLRALLHIQKFIEDNDQESAFTYQKPAGFVSIGTRLKTEHYQDDNPF